MPDAIDHGQRAHAPIGASSAERVIACPGSVQMITRHGVDEPPGRAATEGTRAHELAERALVQRLPIEGEDEMAECARTFVAAVEAEIAREPLTSAALIEARLDMRRFHPMLITTVDAGILLPEARTVTILDLKTGVKTVEADAPQMKIYAGAVLQHFGERAKGIIHVDTVVVQPRAQHRNGPVRRVRHKAADIISYFYDYIELCHRATSANDDLPLNTGSHCFFCGARGACPAYRAEKLAGAAVKLNGNVPAPFAVVDAIPDADLGAVLDGCDDVEAWIEAVRARAFGVLTAGGSVRGWTLKDKRPTRRWADPQAALAALRERGLADNQITTTAIISPAQAERVVGKNDAGQLAPLIVAESSGKTLARADVL
jgi:hypothetical protein